MVSPADYLAQIELALVQSAVIVQFTIVRSWVNIDDGYIRLRATLSNGDFLESAEYFIVQEGIVTTVDYRHQRMNADQTRLNRRWDSTPHHPEVSTSPYHIHVGAENNDVRPSQPMSIVSLLAVLQAELET